MLVGRSYNERMNESIHDFHDSGRWSESWIQSHLVLGPGHAVGRYNRIRQDCSNKGKWESHSHLSKVTHFFFLKSIGAFKPFVLNVWICTAGKSIWLQHGQNGGVEIILPFWFIELSFILIESRLFILLDCSTHSHRHWSIIIKDCSPRLLWNQIKFMILVHLLWSLPFT